MIWDREDGGIVENLNSEEREKRRYDNKVRGQRGLDHQSYQIQYVTIVYWGFRGTELCLKNTYAV